MRLNLSDKDPKRIFFTGDLHIGHANIIKFQNRPFASVHKMNLSLVENWNNVVDPQDFIFVLGDFFFCRPEAIKQIAQKLNGNIHLVLGNHDHESRGFYSNLFHGQIYDYLDLKVDTSVNKAGLIACFHYPIHRWNKCHHGSIHLHGHIHASEPITGINRYDVGVDANNYTPVSLRTIVERIGSHPGERHHEDSQNT